MSETGVVAYDASPSIRRLSGRGKGAPNFSDPCLLVVRILQWSFVVLQLNGRSSLKRLEMFQFLANRPPIQYRHIAQDEAINGRGYVVRPSLNKGNILQYLTARPQRASEKLGLVAEVASALSYLHSGGIVHGNVCPMNILISDDGHAMVTDVGIHTAIVDFTSMPCGDVVPVPPTARYKSPEELTCSVKGLSQTTDKDVYGLASSMYEIVSGHTPFGSMRLFACVVEIAHNGHLRLDQPESITDELWQLLQACWSINPKHRPNIVDVQGHLGALLTEGVYQSEVEIVASAVQMAYTSPIFHYLFYSHF